MGRFTSPCEEVNIFRSNLMLLIQNFFPNGLPLVDIQTEYKRFFKDVMTPRRLAMLQNLTMANLKDETKEEIEEIWEKVFQTPVMYEYFMVPSFEKRMAEKINANGNEENREEEDDEVTIIFDKREMLENRRCKDKREKKSELELEQQEETAVLEEGMGNNNKDIEELEQVDQHEEAFDHQGAAIIFEQNEIENIIELHKETQKNIEMDQQNKETMEVVIDDGKKQELEKDDEKTTEPLKREARKTEGKKVVCRRGRTVVEMTVLAQLASFANVEYVRKFNKSDKEAQITRCFRCKDWTPEENINKKRKENPGSSNESNSDDTDYKPKSKRVYSKHTKTYGTEHEPEKPREGQEEVGGQVKEIVVVVENYLGEKKTITYMGVEWKCDNCEEIFQEKKLLTKHQRECEVPCEPTSKVQESDVSCEPPSKPSKGQQGDVSCEPPSKPSKGQKSKVSYEPTTKPSKGQQSEISCELPSKPSKGRKCKVPYEPPSKIRKSEVSYEIPKPSKVRKSKVSCELPSKPSKSRKCKVPYEPASKPSKGQKCQPPSKPPSPFNCRKCGQGFLSSLTLRSHKLNCSPLASDLNK